MRFLIVNADDFGACTGVNRGIVEAHRHGIVTSTSLMVQSSGAEEAAGLAAGCPELGVGLHALVDPAMDPFGCHRAIEAQIRRFEELLGRPPTHLDSHHHVHGRPELLPVFRRVSRRHGIPLRGYSPVRWCPRFYGQWGGESHPEQISVVSLLRILERDLIDGVTELSCHPGLPDPALVSTYATERERELHTLCDVRVRRFLERSVVRLIHHGHAAGRPAPGLGRR
jgi:chitin disaccharide deacetylase